MAETKKPTEVQENPDAIIKRLEEENKHLRIVTDKAVQENNILRATVKALSNLL